MPEERSRESDHSDARDVEVAARGEKAGRDQNRFPFEEGADEDGEITELLEKRFGRHSVLPDCKTRDMRRHRLPSYRDHRPPKSEGDGLSRRLEVPFR